MREERARQMGEQEHERDVRAAVCGWREGSMRARVSEAVGAY